MSIFDTLLFSAYLLAFTFSAITSLLWLRFVKLETRGPLAVALTIVNGGIAIFTLYFMMGFVDRIILTSINLGVGDFSATNGGRLIGWAFMLLTVAVQFGLSQGVFIEKSK